MGFLRRLLGGGAPQDAASDATPAGSAGADDDATPEADEAERERELLRLDPARTDDDLIQRQLRYANRSWTPPAQGGTRRSGDEGASDD